MRLVSLALVKLPAWLRFPSFACPGLTPNPFNKVPTSAQANAECGVMREVAMQSSAQTCDRKIDVGRLVSRHDVVVHDEGRRRVICSTLGSCQCDHNVKHLQPCTLQTVDEQLTCLFAHGDRGSGSCHLSHTPFAVFLRSEGSNRAFPPLGVYAKRAVLSAVQMKRFSTAKTPNSTDMLQQYFSLGAESRKERQGQA
eukprot:2239529-Rhodomonas_salina.4